MTLVETATGARPRANGCGATRGSEVPTLEARLGRATGSDGVRVRASLARALRLDDPERAQRLADHAVFDSTARRDPALRLDALRAATAASMTADRLHRLDDLTRELLAIARGARSTQHIAAALAAQWYSAATRGDVGLLRRVGADIASLAAADAGAVTCALAAQVRAGDLLAAGDVGALRGSIPRVLSSAAVCGDELLVQGAAAVARLSDWLASSPRPGATGECPAFDPSVPWGRVATDRDPASSDGATLHRAPRISASPEAVPRNALWLARMMACADRARRRNDAGSGRRIATLLGPFANWYGVVGIGASVGSVWLGIGTASEAAGREGEALAAYERAVEANRRVDAVPFARMAELSHDRLWRRLAHGSAGIGYDRLVVVRSAGAPRPFDDALV